MEQKAEAVICDENGFIFNAFINLEPVQRS